MSATTMATMATTDMSVMCTTRMPAAMPVRETVPVVETTPSPPNIDHPERRGVDGAIHILIGIAIYELVWSSIPISVPRCNCATTHTCCDPKHRNDPKHGIFPCNDKEITQGAKFRYGCGPRS